MRLTHALMLVTALSVLGLLGAGCPRCNDDLDDDKREDNDTADTALALSDGKKVTAIVNECDEDFWSISVGVDRSLEIVMTALHPAVDVDGPHNSGGQRLGVRVGEKLLTFSDTDQEPPAEPQDGTVTFERNDKGDPEIMTLALPAAAEDRALVFEVVQEGYADNIAPMVGDYTLTVTATAE